MVTEAALRKAVETFDLKEHIARLDDRQRDSSFGLIVMVVGAGNFGKSSLVNAICGREVAPVSVVPKTFKIDVFSSGEEGTALVRRVGEANPTECSHREARKIEENEEKQFRTKGKSPLAEIVWRHDDLALPPGISLVDTPGISQALRGASKSVSLTTVLGSTFDVDEVWAHWFHRADVVVWAFCANKMEDADTRLALESALRLFDKPIIPVATKADLIPSERWPEVHERFDRAFGSLLDRRQASELHLTVCGGSKGDLVGTGIPELRRSLVEFAKEAERVKVRAEAAFVRDESKAVTGLLSETAKTLVSNLRAIASLGDALAEEALLEAERGRNEAATRVNAYLRTIRTDVRLEEAAKAVHQATNGGRNGDIELEARQSLIPLIDRQRIQQEVNEAFAAGARSLETAATRFSQGADIARLSFKSSGIITRHPIPLRLQFKALSLTSQLDFSMKLKYPSGFLGNAWDVIKRLLGADRFSVADIHNAMSDALDIPESDLDPAMVQALHEGYAPALHEAVRRALLDHLESTDQHALELLREVDFHLTSLEAQGVDAPPTSFGAQAEYWATLSPEAETLLLLAREELIRVLPEFRFLLAERFEFDLPHRVRPFRELWEERTVTPAEVTVQTGLSELIERAEYRERVEEAGVESWADAPFLPYLEATQLAHLEASPISMELDRRLADRVVGVRYRSAGSRLAQIGAEAFQSRVRGSERTWSVTVPQEQWLGWTSGRGTGLGVLGGCLIAALLFFVRIEVSFVVVALTIVWGVIGRFRPEVTALVQYRARLGEAISEEVSTCQTEAANLISLNTVDEVIQGMTAELAPRPLQALLIDAGLLRV